MLSAAKLGRWDDTCPIDGRVDRYEPSYPPDVHVRMHVHAMDTSGVDRVLEDHGHRIALKVREVFSDDIERRAVYVLSSYEADVVKPLI